MTIRISPLNKSVSKVDTFFWAGEDYYSLCEMIHKDLNKVPLHAPLLPMMHLCLELLVKANAAHADAEFDPKKFSHKTSQIIKAYSNHIETFKKFAEDKSKMQLLDALEKAWSAIRYGEVAYRFDGEDYLLFKKMGGELSRELENSRIIRQPEDVSVQLHTHINIKITRQRADANPGQTP
jgi:hypothetical protein